MLEALLSYPFPFVAALVDTLGLALTLYRLPRKRLDVELLNPTSLSDRGDAPKKVAVGGEEFPSDEVSEIVFGVRDAGNVDIEADHFERPIEIVFEKHGLVARAAVLKEAPDNIRASVETSLDGLLLKPVLLNAGDSVFLGAWVVRYAGVKVDGRIVGVKDVRQIPLEKRVYRRARPLGLALMVCAVLLFVGEFLAPTGLAGTISGAATGLAMVTGWGILFLFKRYDELTDVRAHRKIG